MREKVKAKVLVALWCPTLCDPIDCNSPGSSVRGILQTSTGVGGHSLSPGDLPNLDSGLLYCRRILYHLSHEGSPNRASYLTIYIYIYMYHSVQFNRSVMSNSLQPCGLKQTRIPCPSPTPGAYSNSCLPSQ